MHAHRARFAKEIVAEFVPPARPSKKVVIFCDGMPSMPHKPELMEFFRKKNWWVFHPRYRGSWESSGQLLWKPPHHDILDVIKGLPRGFKSIWTGKKFKLKPEKVVIVGSSFGGATGLLASKSDLVDKVVALSPVIDWRSAKRTDEPLDKAAKLIKEAFGEAYRTSLPSWKLLKTGKYFNPIEEAEGIDGNKLFIIHAKDDRTTPYRDTVKFVKMTGAEFWSWKKGGHLGLSTAMTPRAWKRLAKFLR